MNGYHFGNGTRVFELCWGQVTVMVYALPTIMEEHSKGASTALKLGLGVGIGTVVFIMVFLFVGFLDIYLKKKQGLDYNKHFVDANDFERRRKQERHRNPNADNNVKPTKDGVAFSVPEPGSWKTNRKQHDGQVGPKRTRKQLYPKGSQGSDDMDSNSVVLERCCSNGSGDDREISMRCMTPNSEASCDTFGQIEDSIFETSLYQDLPHTMSVTSLDADKNSTQEEEIYPILQVQNLIKYTENEAKIKMFLPKDEIIQNFEENELQNSKTEENMNYDTDEMEHRLNESNDILRRTSTDYLTGGKLFHPYHGSLSAQNSPRRRKRSVSPPEVNTENVGDLNPIEEATANPVTAAVIQEHLVASGSVDEVVGIKIEREDKEHGCEADIERRCRSSPGRSSSPMLEVMIYRRGRSLDASDNKLDIDTCTPYLDTL